jgi:hypothetical protein
LENQKLSKEFSGKLNSESSKLAHLVGQVQKDTEAELMAVKNTLKTLAAD